MSVSKSDSLAGERSALDVWDDEVARRSRFYMEMAVRAMAHTTKVPEERSGASVRQHHFTNWIRISAPTRA